MGGIVDLTFSQTAATFMRPSRPDTGGLMVLARNPATGVLHEHRPLRGQHPRRHR
jgi:hypothetical protein